MRRLREGGRPAFPPEPRDAMLLGGTVFGLLEQEHGARRAAALATSDLERCPRSVLVDAFRWQASSATGAPSSTRSRRPDPYSPSVLAMMFFWISDVPP